MSLPFWPSFQFSKTLVEYSSTLYLLFQIAEYLNIVLLCSMMTILFFGGWLPPTYLALYDMNRNGEPARKAFLDRISSEMRAF